jgi:hypothetical protein
MKPGHGFLNAVQTFRFGYCLFGVVADEIDR